jgi:hypothetical protein
MKQTLIVIATAGALASGAAIGQTTVRADQRHAIAPVQYAQPLHERAQPSYDRWDDRSLSVNEREARIKVRIDRGYSDGRLTEYEARRLLRQLASLEGKERTFMSDGRLNRRENAELSRDLDQLASNVRFELNDQQRRY